MPKASKIRVMLSSRCHDPFPSPDGPRLSDTRIALKKEIEAQTLWAHPLFEVWINEDAPPLDATQDSWEACLQAARDCDVMIVLSNGNAGWARSGGDIGICHAEYMEALNAARGKVRLIALPPITPRKGADGERDRRFQAYVEQQRAFRGGEVDTLEKLRTRVFEALTDAVLTLTQRGVHAEGSRRFDMGQALNWSRLDFRQRKRAMEAVLRSALQAQPGARIEGDDVVLPLAGEDVAVVLHAIPAAFTVGAARELVGRPFLLDHERAPLLKKAQGPLHLIACHRGATETQATNLLGFADATVVSAPFGIYVADEVQKVQFVFLVNCRDESQTRHAAQRFLEWLDQTGEAAMLAQRARSRARIVKVIASESGRHGASGGRA